MRLASLFTGGKDSVYATHLVLKRGDTISHLVSMYPKRSDSWMFHTVNLHLVPLSAEALGIPYIQVGTSGEEEEEVEDLKQVLSRLDIDGVASGAIASNYQKSRIERICCELNLVPVTPLWGRDPVQLLEEMINSGMIIMVTAVAAHGLDRNWLGMTLDQSALRKLEDLSKRYGINACGEGGEMETLVLDAPFFRKRLKVLRVERLWEGNSGTLFVEAELAEKRLQEFSTS